MTNDLPIFAPRRPRKPGFLAWTREDRARDGVKTSRSSFSSPCSREFFVSREGCVGRGRETYPKILLPSASEASHSGGKPGKYRPAKSVCDFPPRRGGIMSEKPLPEQPELIA
jgi:hypothetical protein